jgi:UDP-3-O-acyl N-acetylglucosamine deacetylase
MTNLRRLGFRYQRTLGRAVEVTGVGFLTGATVRLRFQPAPPCTGLVFVRSDVRAAAPIPARVHQVTGTQRRTTLGHLPVQVGLVEHVLAALAGLRIDNCIIELNAPEPPGLDGSARGFVDVLHDAGTLLQEGRRSIWTVSRPVVLSQGGATLALYPVEDELKITYALDYGPGSSLPPQCHTQIITPEEFANELAACRTFILESEAVELRRQGLGSRTTAADLLVFGPKGPIDNRLRYANEPARHKILDLVGDLALFGHDVRGHVVAYRSGHPMNIQLARALAGAAGGTCAVPRLAA